MCGLSAVLGGSEEELRAMNLAMARRGVAATTARAGPWGLGRVRLPIVGLAPEFDAPFERKGWTFCFVGEVVNFREIAPTARCDVEVLARAWALQGPTCLRGFDGFWAVAAVTPDGGLQVATDFLSKKPLYYRTDRVAYASEIKALAALGPMTPDPVYFSSVMKWGYHPGDRTPAREVRRMGPGELRVHRPLGGVEVMRLDGPRDLGVEASARDVRAAVELSVRRRVLSSDVPVALLLSGGLDSSIVYLLAKKFRGDVRVYHAPNDEAEYLDLLGVDEATTVEFAGADEEDVLRDNEGPVDLGSVFPQRALGRAVEESVCLSGDGADELFGGYRRAAEYDSQGSDVFEELVYYHLPRLDKLMMAGTVELRCPFLGRGVVDAALSVPHARRRRKEILKEAFADLVPRAILEREKHPLKTREVIDGGVERRRRLCDLYRDMMERGVAF